MRRVWALSVATACAGSAWSAAPETWHYLGEIKLSGPDGKSYGSQVMLLEKTYDPERSEASERAILMKPDGKVEDHTVRLKITGDKFTLSASDKSVEGSGTLSGPAWKWTYMKGVFTTKGGIRVEDENFMSDPSVLTARQTVTGPDNKVIVRMDMSLKLITPGTFTILAATALKQ